MVSTKELQAREMDDESKSIAEIARDIAPKLGTTVGVARNWIFGKRKGYESFSAYQKETGITSMKRLNERAVSKNHKNYRGYVTSLLIERGFLSVGEYQSFLRQRKKGIVSTKAEFFERQIKRKGKQRIIQYESLEKLSEIPSEEEPEKLKDLRSKLELLINTLTERERLVIQIRYFKDKTLEETGKLLDYTRENIRLIQEKALRKLYFRAKSSDLYEEYTQ